MNDAPTISPPRIVFGDDQDELAALLQRAQRLLLEHPVAAQAIFRAFVAEGRAFAKTNEGRQWREDLARSELIRRGRVVWEVGTLNLLEENADTVLPSKLLDALVHAAGVEGLEPFLSKLFETTKAGIDDR